MTADFKQYGPTITTVYSCGDCVFLKSEKYTVEDGNDYDWGYAHTCTSPELDAPRDVPTRSNTPAWCPYRAQEPKA